jgi:hypothetical protein
MFKQILNATILISIISLMSCTTLAGKESPGMTVRVQDTPIDFSESGYSDYLHTIPLKGNPVFFAAVQRMNDRDKEAPAALLSASEQASKFIAVKAVSEFYSEKMNSSIKYMRDLDVIWDRDLALDMIDRLEVLQISQDTYGTYLTAKLSDEKISKLIWTSGKKTAAPDWTSNIPVIPGYIVSVGIALQTGYVADSFAAADNQALEDLARQISVKIVTGRKQLENSVGSVTVQTNYETSEVIIPGFYVLERWRTPDMR